MPSKPAAPIGCRPWRCIAPSRGCWSARSRCRTASRSPARCQTAPAARQGTPLLSTCLVSTIVQDPITPLSAYRGFTQGAEKLWPSNIQSTRHCHLVLLSRKHSSCISSCHPNVSTVLRRLPWAELAPCARSQVYAQEPFWLHFINPALEAKFLAWLPHATCVVNSTSEPGGFAAKAFLIFSCLKTSPC